MIHCQGLSIIATIYQRWQHCQKMAALIVLVKKARSFIQVGKIIILCNILQKIHPKKRVKGLGCKFVRQAVMAVRCSEMRTSTVVT